MRVQIFTVDDDDTEHFRDFYVNADKIDGWYRCSVEDFQELCLNVFINGDFVTLKQTQNLVDYLLTRKDIMDE
jgi:hypothetical protein